MNDLALFSIIIAYLAFSIAVPLALYYAKKINSSLARNLIHLLSGMCIFSLYFAENKYVLLAIAVVTTLLLFLSKSKTPILSKLFNAIAEKEERKLNLLEGPALYGTALTILIILAIATGDNNVAVASTLILVLSDPIAALVGRKFGKTKIGKRSLEGSIAMFATNLAILTFLYSLTLNTILISVSVALVELVSPSKVDDLTVPLSAAILLLLI